MTPHSIAAIKSAIDFPAFVAEYIPIQKSGAQYLGLCLWHKDSKPSLRIYADHFFCFACTAHGDVIDFVAHVENISKGSAIRQLAERYGVSLDGPVLNRAQRTLEREERAFAEWWQGHVVGRLERKLTAYVRRLGVDVEGLDTERLDYRTTEDECETIGILLRQIRTVKRAEIAEVARRCATSAERAEWRAEREDVRVWTEVVAGACSGAVGAEVDSVCEAVGCGR